MDFVLLICFGVVFLMCGVGADYFGMTSFRLDAAAIFGQDFRTALCAATSIVFEHSL